MMISSDDALRYVETGIPDMLGDVDGVTQEYYEKFVNRIRYLTGRDIGEKPKYHRGMRVCYDYWTCGNCGATVKKGVEANFCDKCGCRIIWDQCRTLTG